MITDMTGYVSPLGYHAMSMKFKEKLSGLVYLAQIVGVMEPSWTYSEEKTLRPTGIISMMGGNVTNPRVFLLATPEDRRKYTELFDHLM